MQVGYVVLYVTDADACRDFWVNKVGMQLRESIQVMEHSIHKIGFGDSNFSFELVPLKLMENNPDQLDLASPSICFYVDDLTKEHARLKDSGITTSDISARGGKESFAFSDNESRWFAVMESK